MLASCVHVSVCCKDSHTILQFGRERTMELGVMPAQGDEANKPWSICLICLNKTTVGLLVGQGKVLVVKLIWVI